MFPAGPPAEKNSPKFKVEEIERIKSSSLKERCCYFREDARPRALPRTPAQ